MSSTGYPSPYEPLGISGTCVSYELNNILMAVWLG